MENNKILGLIGLATRARKICFGADSVEERIIENDNLLKLCFDFCDVEDILNLSLTSKKFYKKH